jgi:hypothetical protein
VEGNAKAARTIDICGITHLNAARLADAFQDADVVKAEDALRSFFSLPTLDQRLAHLDLLRAMANEFNLAQAQAIVGFLEREIQPQPDID